MHETRSRPCCKCYTVSRVNDCQKIAVSDRAVSQRSSSGRYGSFSFFSYRVLSKSTRDRQILSKFFFYPAITKPLCLARHSSLDHGGLRGTKMVELCSRNFCRKFTDFSTLLYKFLSQVYRFFNFALQIFVASLPIFLDISAFN